MSSCTDLKRPLLASLLLSALAGCGKMSNVTRGAGFGVNLAGAEFGALRPDFSNANAGTHGTDYFFPSRDAMVYYANRGISLVRVPLSWERLQPRLGEQLDPGYLARILECLDHASQLDCSVVLPRHSLSMARACPCCAARLTARSCPRRTARLTVWLCSHFTASLDGVVVLSRGGSLDGVAAFSRRG